jgi:hypothetical protein
MVEASKNYIYLKVRSGLQMLLDDKNGLGSEEVVDGRKTTTLKDVLGPVLKSDIEHGDMQLKMWLEDPDTNWDGLTVPQKLPKAHWWWRIKNIKDC